MNQLTPNAKQQFWDDDGNFLVGGKLFTYIAGTSTPAATYQSKNGAANTNPIILNSRGECDLWLAEGAFKFVLKDANDVEIYSVDDVTAVQNGEGFFDLTKIEDTTFDEPMELAAGTQIPFSGQSPRNIIFVKSTGGAVTLTNNPAIAPGVVFGQLLKVYGVDNTNYPILPSNIGVKTNGDKVFQQHSTADFLWIGTMWVEQGVNNI